MKKKNRIVFFVFCSLIFFGCKTPSVNIAGNYIYKTECLGNNLDGTIILKAWGNGVNKKEAIKQAKKNALESVLFTVITDGKSECDNKPLLAEVNIQKKQETYFNVFFSDKGDYSAFISAETKQNKTDVKPARNGVTVGIVAKVLKSDLEKKMITDGIKIII
ncbi:hypothetical protein [Flavobacterium algicola]|uniref:hypothetical protein n=1 Tax=Flavobacterium algicola TaxID=556529 RepID=UPI001EFCE35C|nr:hypothetical protein [Flavobacterium algicola]MCG9791165.1 hypothetical protein [Flavobacterium algicola]